MVTTRVLLSLASAGSLTLILSATRGHATLGELGGFVASAAVIYLLLALFRVNL